jgi:ABC-type antimicrobial peptide transport system permease subunit
MLTALGWAAGVPLGYAGARLLDHLVSTLFHLRFPFEFPFEFVWLALGGAIALALVVMIAPLRRAARLRPGDALRYQ